MFKRRAAHKLSSSSPQYPVISAPTNFVKLAGMGNLGETTPIAANSPMPEPIPNKQDDGPEDTGAVGEPLVQDFQQLQEQGEARIKEPPTPPKISVADFQPLGSHPVASSSDEETAPPPPDLTRRGIHIPTRTR